MRLRLVRRLCFIMICTVVALYVVMQYYAEPKERNLINLQRIVKDFHEIPQNPLSMHWLTDPLMLNKRPVENMKPDPSLLVRKEQATKSKLILNNKNNNNDNDSRDNVVSTRGGQVKLQTFQAPTCQRYDKFTVCNTTFQMGEVYNQLAFDNKPGGAWTQGFPISYNMDHWKDRPLEVFIVPFSHQDPGWRKTLEDYFYTETKPNLDATLEILSEHKEARFVYSEISFLNLWLTTLSEEQKRKFQRLLFNGQWEISSGGWVMPDEAVTNYYSIIDQFIEGHHWLLEHFDYRPNTTWSIDPFGQSSTMAYLAKKFGFSHMIINRVHYEVKKHLALQKALEFYWYQLWDSTKSHGMLAHMFPFFSYDIPHTCGPEPAICCQFDFLRMEKYNCPWHISPVRINSENVAARAEILADQYRKKATLYNNNGLVLIPLGDDFRYISKHEWNLQLENYNKLIEHINSNSNYRMKIRFATISDYFTVLSQRVNEAHSTLPTFFPSLSGDFFTYADRQHDYWSGYYNSRPYQKALSRLLESELRTAEILYTYARQSVGRKQNTVQLLPLISSLYENLTTVRRNLGLFQHHDAITGTAKPEVVLDYSNKLLKAVGAVRKVITLSSVYLLSLSSKLFNEEIMSNRLPISSELKQRLFQLNDEYERYNENDYNSYNSMPSFHSLEDHLHTHEFPQPILINFLLTNPATEHSRRIYLFNPSTRNRTTIITLHVNGHYKNFQAKQIYSNPLESSSNDQQLTIQLQHTVIKYPSKQHQQQQQQSISLLYLSPVKLFPLSFSCIELKLLSEPTVLLSSLSSSSSSGPIEPVKPQLVPVIESGKLPTMTNSQSLSIENAYIQLEFDPKTGYLQKMFNKLTQQSMDIKINFVQYKTPSNSESNSGPYLFISDGIANPMPQPKSYSYIKGDLVDTVTVYTKFVEHTVRLYKSPDIQSQFIEIENIVDIRVDTPTDIDLFMTIETNLLNEDRVFYTDSNCFQFIERKYYDKIPLQGNIYPIACGAYIEHAEHQVNNEQTTMRKKRMNIFTSHSTGVVSPKIGQLNIWLDRRSSRDDSRGIASNLHGDWIVQSKLYLFTEEITTSLDNNEASKQTTIPSLTLFAQQILNYISQPAHKFLVNDLNLNKLLTLEYNLIPQSGLQCDYELVTMKTFHNSKIPKSFHAAPNTQVGIIIRRYLPFCYATKLPLIDFYTQCFVSRVENTWNVKEFFNSLQVSHAIQTNLTLIPSPSSPPSLSVNSNDYRIAELDEIHVKPMELEAYYLV
ncbi:unnamed protein product [Trichobilharzia szidati]|nr:unnamed protein product [Trichobilharzia szidati]